MSLSFIPKLQSKAIHRMPLKCSLVHVNLHASLPTCELATLTKVYQLADGGWSSEKGV